MFVLVNNQHVCDWMLAVLKESASPLRLEKSNPLSQNSIIAATARKSKLRASSRRCPLSNLWIPTRALLILFVRVDRLRGSALRTT